MSACRYCGFEVRWVRTVAGKMMPLDAEPTEDGNVVLVNGAAVILGRGHPVPAQTDDGELYMPHHATCQRYPGRGR